MWQDVRFAFRTGRRQIVGVAVIVLTLGVAIGANTAIFTIAYQTVLRPLPFSQQERLVVLWSGFPRVQVTHLGLAGPEVLELRSLTHALESVAAFRFESVTIDGRSGPTEIPSGRASAELFDALGVPVLVGRTYGRQEDRPGGASVAVLSYGTWSRLFGGDPHIVGTAINVDGTPHTILGVMPRDFSLLGTDVGVWLPLRLDITSAGSRSNHIFRVIARLRDGISARAADADLRDTVRIWQESTGEVQAPTPRLHPLTMETLRDATVGALRPVMLTLLGAVGLLLLIACANVATLMLASAEARRTEVAVRLAIGASCLRLARQMLTESTVIALAGAALGLVIGDGVLRFLRRVAPPELLRADAAAIDGPALVFTLAIACATGLLFGLAPVLRLSQQTSLADLKSGLRGSGGDRGGRRLRQALVVAELALSITLVAGSVSMLRSFSRLMHVDPGFDPTGAVVVEVNAVQSRYPTDALVWAFYDRVLERIRALPGVTAAGAMSGLPPSRPANNTTLFVDGQIAVDHTEVPQADFIQFVSPNYFRALGVPVVAGRLFSDDDRERALPVAIVNQTMARKLWPSGPAVGGRVRPAMPKAPWLTVVGVVGDVKQAGLQADTGTELYVPLRQSRNVFDMFLIRTLNIVVKTRNADAGAIAPAIRGEIMKIDPALAVSAVEGFPTVLERSTARQRFMALSLGLAAGITLLLATIGVYAALSHLVVRRTQEFGVRLALGARRAQVFGLVCRQALALIVASLTLGAIGVAATSRLISGLLFRVAPNDPATLVGVMLLLTFTAMGASLVPAWRATRVDPIAALRQD